ncbi:hypothetical protein ZIOFF_019756 [Zingiber officinale]|uniref:Lipase n=1 Tax=Zingiber officinale TaxID=94328 RepID=A0A8J5HEN4_ZINOF|nr:hypothetical protein ZIOFF_019756 [Zingiber officinale]
MPQVATLPPYKRRVSSVTLNSPSFIHSLTMAFFRLLFIFVLFQYCEAAGELYDTPDPVRADGLCATVVDPQGYKCQEFEVITEDGYILALHRITQGRGRDDGPGRQAVLLQHGVLMDGMTWLLNSPEESLAFILADAEFDVWIANVRGTKWSRRHVALDPSSPAYWYWSWDELSMYDLTTTVDFVFNQTGQKLHYVGHSMGTTIALAALSERRLVDKLKSAALLSPVAYLSHMTSALGIIAANSFTGELLRWFGHGEFNPKGLVAKDFLNSICHATGVDCYDFMTAFTGINCCLNSSSIDYFLQFEPQPTSVKTLVQFAETVYRDGVVTRYHDDWRLGSGTTAAYDISNIPRDFPLLLSYGGRDSLTAEEDVQLLLNDLRDHEKDKLRLQLVEEYAHMDFVMAVNAKSVVYDGVIEFFKRQS